MTKKLFFILFLASLLIIPLIVAQDSTATPSIYYKKANTIDFQRPCFSNGTYCSGSAVCNLTVTQIFNSTVIINNKVMTNMISFHNYTINSTGLVNGDYQANMVCTDNGLSGSDTPIFQINPTGLQPTDQRTNSTTRAIYIIFGITIIFFLGFIFFENVPIKWSFFIISITFFVAAINLIFVTLTNEIIDPNIINLFDFISAASFYFYWLAGGLLFIIWVLTLFNTMNTNFANKRYDKFGGNLYGNQR